MLAKNLYAWAKRITFSATVSREFFIRFVGARSSRKNTYHSGLKILDAGESCLDLYSQDQSMRKVKYTSRGEGATQLGLW